jgi:hypothetical protein
MTGDDELFKPGSDRELEYDVNEADSNDVDDGPSSFHALFRTDRSPDQSNIIYFMKTSIAYVMKYFL